MLPTTNNNKRTASVAAGKKRKRAKTQNYTLISWSHNNSPSTIQDPTIFINTSDCKGVGVQGVVYSARCNNQQIAVKIFKDLKKVNDEKDYRIK